MSLFGPSHRAAVWQPKISHYSATFRAQTRCKAGRAFQRWPGRRSVRTGQAPGRRNAARARPHPGSPRPAQCGPQSSALNRGRNNVAANRRAHSSSARSSAPGTNIIFQIGSSRRCRPFAAARTQLIVARARNNRPRASGSGRENAIEPHRKSHLAPLERLARSRPNHELAGRQ